MAILFFERKQDHQSAFTPNISDSSCSKPIKSSRLTTCSKSTRISLPGSLWQFRSGHPVRNGGYGLQKSEQCGFFWEQAVVHIGAGVGHVPQAGSFEFPHIFRVAGHLVPSQVFVLAAIVVEAEIMKIVIGEERGRCIGILYLDLIIAEHRLNSTSIALPP